MNKRDKFYVIRSLMGLLNTPIAQRKGVCISPEDCKIWVEELETFIKNESNVIKDSDPPKNI